MNSYFYVSYFYNLKDGSSYKYRIEFRSLLLIFVYNNFTRVFKYALIFTQYSAHTIIWIYIYQSFYHFLLYILILYTRISDTLSST